MQFVDADTPHPRARKNIVGTPASNVISGLRRSMFFRVVSFRDFGSEAEELRLFAAGIYGNEKHFCKTAPFLFRSAISNLFCVIDGDLISLKDFTKISTT
jgi:hypothetical protein